MYARRQEVERHGEDHIDHQHEDTDEPRRSSATGDQGRRHRGDQHHYHGARPELQIHRSRAEDIAEQYQPTNNAIWDALPSVSRELGFANLVDRFRLYSDRP